MVNIDEKALELAQSIAREHKITDTRTIALIQLGAIAGIKSQIPCTCLSDLEDDAYDPGGPMSGQKRPPPCIHHSKKDNAHAFHVGR